MGDEGTHAAQLGERQRLSVVGLAGIGVEPVRMDRDVPEQVPPPRSAQGLAWGGLIASALVYGLALLTASGCVTLWTYERPGVDEVQTRRDVDLCREMAKAPRVPRPFQIVGAAITSVPYENLDRIEFDACMHRNGYTRIVP